MNPIPKYSEWTEKVPDVIEHKRTGPLTVRMLREILEEFSSEFDDYTIVASDVAIHETYEPIDDRLINVNQMTSVVDKPICGIYVNHDDTEVRLFDEIQLANWDKFTSGTIG
jgi:hypothetical protein